MRQRYQNWILAVVLPLTYKYNPQVAFIYGWLVWMTGQSPNSATISVTSTNNSEPILSLLQAQVGYCSE